MLNINGWNKMLGDSHYRLLTNKNPYSPETMEHGLIQFLIENIEIINSSGNDKINIELLHFLSLKNISIDIDPWNLNKLLPYTLSLGHMNGIIAAGKIPINDINKEINFGIYLEEGMINPINLDAYTKFLSKMSDEKRREDLWRALYINNDIRKVFEIPELIFENNNQITLKNLNRDIYNVTNIPISAWSFPYNSEDWIGIKSRGLFHHIGDQIGFIIAAINYGNCYILGKDEFGDLIILAKYLRNNNKHYKVHDKVNAYDFNYIYGVPKGTEHILTKKTFLSSDKEDCLINTEKNSYYSESFWNNDVFKEMAGRETHKMSFSELVKYFIYKSEQVFPKKFEKSKKEILDKYEIEDTLKLLSADIIISGNSNEIEDIFESDDNISRDVKSLWVHWVKNNFTKSVNIKILLNIILCKKIDLISMYPSQIMIYENLSYYERKSIYLRIKEYFLNKTTKIISNGDINTNMYNKKILKKLFKLIDSLPLTQLLMLDLEDLEKQLKKNNTLFFKTFSHKAVCEIINPHLDLELGFFMKNDGNEKNKLLIDYTYFYIEYLKQDEKNKYEFMSKYFYSAIVKFLDKTTDDIIQYLIKLDTPAFFVSEVVDMRNEYRMFVINNRVVATSPCFRNTIPLNAWQNGRFDPRLGQGHNATELIIDKNTRQRVAKYALFAREFNKRVKEKYPDCKNYVLDVAWSNEKNCVVPIEINSITWSGAYQINFHRLCSAIANKKFDYSTLFTSKKINFSFYELINSANQKLINDGIINQTNMNLNGLDRTFRKNMDKLNLSKINMINDKKMNDKEEDNIIIQAFKNDSSEIKEY